MRFRSLIVPLVLMTVVGLVFSDIHRQALAADTSGGTSDGVIWSGVQAGYPSSSTSSGGSACTWHLMVTYDANIGLTTNISKVVDGIRYDLYEKRCAGSSTSVWIPRLGASQVARSAAVLVQSRLPSPTASFAPASTSMVVKAPSWFWVDPSWWTPVTATAWIPTIFGPLWSRTTATPTRLLFFTQDDGTTDGNNVGSTSCFGPGWIWDVTLGDDAMSPCMYTYQHSSASRPTGTFLGVVGVEWRITWTSSTGAGGDLPSFTTMAFVWNRVDELQALVG